MTKMDQYPVVNATQDTILDTVHRWTEAERQRDVAALDPLLHPELRVVGPRGFVLTKSETLDRFRNGLKYEAIGISDTEVRMFGPASVLVIGALSQHASYQGYDSSGKFRVTLVMVPHEGRWLIASMHYSPMADMPAGGNPPAAARAQQETRKPSDAPAR